MSYIQIPQTLQTAGPFNLGGAEILTLVVYVGVIAAVVTVVKAIVRASRALESIAATLRDRSRT